ncbi:polysaccharide biosynthesis tyrosine autokinase [Mucilaginibacter limnophilus]|uniref:non-specific protein-tyrosine kinase n=1 Tax=Mucilaginibacter limnophilus TaxID=1932778 RepID=A0A3S2UR04_9SPHI|nr:tyrosine-protein kinase family protein [Mucilaginibacter limnophilus]RVU02462.1 polysaccharide biosynthesis tyrosine autokinase [Mucilaginibacter limnophilus]
MSAYHHEKENINVHYFLDQVKSYWYLFVISLILFIGLAYAYNTFATKQYLVSSTMLLQPRPVNQNATTAYANDGITDALNTAENLKNEGDVLRSRNLMKEVVQAMSLNVRSYQNSGLLASEIYEDAPFTVQVLNHRVDSVKKRAYIINMKDNESLHITNEDEYLDKWATFGKKIRLPQYDIVITRKPGMTWGKEYSIEITDEDDAVTTLLKGYDAEFIDKATTSVEFTFYYPHPKKGEVILQTLMNRYLQDNINNKKRIIDSSINFIDKRIAVVEKELDNIERNFQDYRSNNNIADINEQSKVLVGNASEYANRSQQQKIQLSIINDLKNRLRDPDNQETIPGSLNIQDASFTASLVQYNNLLTERAKRKLSLSETNPIIVNIDQQLQVVRKNLLQSINSYQKEMQLSSQGISNQAGVLNSSLRDVPGKQRAIIGFSRQQELKQQLYMYLLQKREETSMAKAAEIPYSRVLDNAKSSKSPVKPVKSIIYTMSFFLGLIIPFGYINTRKMLSTKIVSEADIKKQTDLAIIGKIGHHGLPEKRVVDVFSRSPVAESFRTLRTKLRNILHNGSNVIMITSSVNGEGKTFLTWNLGSTLARAGKTVVILELDLRKPKLSGMLGIDHNDYGFSSYVLDGADADEIIKQSGHNDNCYIISSGPLVQNASELLLDDKLGQLIEELRHRFDYVLIDSSPVGLVSDALIIQKHVDATIYVCRHNYTNKAQIEIINEIKNKDKVDNMYLVINDVNYSKAGYNGYGYGLGYDY